jgi:phosphate-selective porin OprO/OprP
LTAVLLAAGALIFPAPAGAGAGGEPPGQPDRVAGGRIPQPGQDIRDLRAQVRDIEQSAAHRYGDIRNGQAVAAKVTIANGRPTISGGDFSLSLRALVQYDSAYYAQGKAPAGTDFSSGSNFRRARFGFEGTAFDEWSYQFVYDLGGSPGAAASISSAYIQYDGLAPVHLKIGAFPPPESFDDSTSASDLLFLERAQPADLGRGIAGADGREAIDIHAYDEGYFASLAYTGRLTSETGAFDEQQALVGRVVYRPIASDSANLAVGGNFTYVLKFPDLSAGANAAHALRLRERPELNVDDNNIRLIDTGNIDAGRGLEWGVEAAGNWRNFYGQGGYFGFSAERRPGGNPAGLPDPAFNGWYVQGSWVLTGEAKKYKPETGSWAIPRPVHPFTMDEPGIGAWEIAARYSDLGLDYRAGAAGAAAPAGGIRGGDQRIWTFGINWYPNPVLRFALDYQYTDVSRLDSTGGDLGARLDAISLRTQISI